MDENSVYMLTTILDWSSLEALADEKINETNQMLDTSIFSFSHNVFRRPLKQGLDMHG